MRIILSFFYAPIVYFLLLYNDITINDITTLKIFPFLFAVGFTIVIVISYIRKKSLILYFARKMSKEEILDDEIEYIHKSTLFWIIISIINTIIHFIVFLGLNEFLWVFYSSIGGYLLLAFAGLTQFLHRKYIFKRNEKCQV